MSEIELQRLRTEMIQVEASIRSEMKEADTVTKLSLKDTHQLAQQAWDKSCSTAGWMNKLALGVLSAVVMAVLKDAGVI